ncbi:alpha/beta hydrolase [Novosphingobium profundi]|uniref:alpha/beta fold hydrolase n=1 Tax=Novosphingobium profundi TaxID=1774954 RepID=UPI001BDA252E|nr:alpha/beta hydrolase [Novosphingobium profundi]
MKLLFLHGWGFNRHFWDPLRAALAEHEGLADDRGYFGAPLAPAIEGPCLALAHSFGTMRVLADPPPGLVGLVAFNGFDRFGAHDGRAGVPLRVIDRMARRLGQDPAAVLAEFRRTCGASDECPQPDQVPLAADLARLRDERAPMPEVPLTLVQGAADPLLSAEMREGAFSGCEARRLVHPGGHLLPREDPAFCAEVVRAALATLPT